MRNFIIAAALLAAGAAQAQTYDFDIGAFGIGGTFTDTNGAFSNISITGDGTTFDNYGGAGYGGDGYTFYGDQGNVSFTAGVQGGIGLAETSINFASCMQFPTSQQWQPCNGYIGVVSKTTAVPEINPGYLVSALALLLGALAVLRGRRSWVAAPLP